MYHFYYTDSIENTHKIFFRLNEYNSVMELIWDRGLEDWGDCKGRAWCATCHVTTNQQFIAQDIESDERNRLQQIDYLSTNSRLACQIPLNEKSEGITYRFQNGS